MYVNCWNLWNKSNRRKLSVVVKQHKPDILLVGETWLTAFHTSSAVALDDYSVLARKDRQIRQKKGGGVLTYVKDGVDATAHAALIPRRQTSYGCVCSLRGAHTYLHASTAHLAAC